MSSIEVLSVASEVFPLLKTGGLADVAGALPTALAPEGVAVRTLMPGYPTVMAALQGVTEVHRFAELVGGPARLLAGTAAGLDMLVLDAPALYDRPGNPYIGPDGHDWPDNAQRFASLARAAAAIGHGVCPGFVPDIVHAHDWQAGLAPAYLAYDVDRYPRAITPGTVMTVHNMAFQGRFPASLMPSLGLPDRAYAVDGVEFYGGVGYLKAGLQLADRITTVSPTYAAEVLGAAAGMGLEGLLRHRADVLYGIVNGIDDVVWNPATDTTLPAPFDATTIARREASRAALRARMGLDEEPDTLLFGVVSRLSWQKGLDILQEALPRLIAAGCQLAVLGTGEPAIEQAFRAAAAAHPGRVGCLFAYDEPLAHLMQAGSDALLVPSRFEPCGLTQLYALRYGALPVVARVGGLADTVIDANAMALARGVATGVQFAPTTRGMLEFAIRRTVDLWRDRSAWQAIQQNAMATDVSWRTPARHYARLYREILAERAAPVASRATRLETSTP